MVGKDNNNIHYLYPQNQRHENEIEIENPTNSVPVSVPVPEFRFIRSDTFTEEEFSQEGFEEEEVQRTQSIDDNENNNYNNNNNNNNTNKSSTPLKLFNRYRIKLRSRSRSRSKSPSTSPHREEEKEEGKGDAHGQGHRLSRFLRLDRRSRSPSTKNSGSVSYNGPSDPLIQGTSDDDVQEREVQWEKRAIMLVKGNSVRFSTLSRSPSMDLQLGSWSGSGSVSSNVDVSYNLWHIACHKYNPAFVLIFLF